VHFSERVVVSVPRAVNCAGVRGRPDLITASMLRARASVVVHAARAPLVGGGTLVTVVVGGAVGGTVGGWEVTGTGSVVVVTTVGGALGRVSRA
jgi:hypothetical protein